MRRHEKIDYVEFPARDLAATKRFFEQVFGWTFADFGAEYSAFSGQGIDGGFFQSDKYSTASQGAALVVFYSSDLEATLGKIESAGGSVVKPIFGFPGGHRFQFTEPSGNEFGVWSDVWVISVK